jgi:hypothetical protein
VYLSVNCEHKRAPNLCATVPNRAEAVKKTAPAKLKNDAIPPAAASSIGMLVPSEAGLLREWTREQEPGSLPERLPSSMFIGMVYRMRTSFHTDGVRKSPPDTGPYNRWLCSVKGGVE